MKAYFAISFAMFAVLGAALTVNWATVARDVPPLQAFLVALGISVTIWSLYMVVVVLLTKGKR